MRDIRAIGVLVLTILVLGAFPGAILAQEPRTAVLGTPHFTVGNDGTRDWRTYISINNPSGSPQSWGWYFFNQKSQIRFWVEFESDHAMGYMGDFSNRPPIPPGGSEIIKVLPCEDPTKYGCQQTIGLQTGAMSFYVPYLMSAMSGKYETALNIQVTIQALSTNGTPYSSLAFGLPFISSFASGSSSPTIGPKNFVMECLSTPQFSTGIALALMGGNSSDVNLFLRDHSGKVIAEKTVTLVYFSNRYMAQMFDELFPQWSERLPVGTLEVVFTGGTANDPVSGAAMAVRIDYIDGKEIRMSNLSVFPK